MKKRVLVSLLIAGVLLIGVLAVSIVNRVQTAGLDYIVEHYRKISSSGYQPAIFSSPADIDKFWEENQDIFIHGYTSEFKDYDTMLLSSAYNWLFFLNRRLLFCPLPGESSSTQHLVNCIYLKDGVLTVEIDAQRGITQTLDFVVKYFLINVDKSLYSKEINVVLLD